MSSIAWGLLLLLSFIWGASFYFIEVGLGYLDPYWLVSLRLVTGAIALTAWLVLTGNMPVPNFSLSPTRSLWIAGAVMGVLNNIIPFSLIAIGQQYVTGGMASILNANTAFMGVIVSGLFLAAEPAKWHRIIGVIIGIFGVSIAIGLENLSGGTEDSTILWGQIAIILATISYAFAGVWGKVKLAGFQPIHGAVVMLVCSAVISVFVASLFSGKPPPAIFSAPFDMMLLVIGLGVFGTALAYPLYFRILELAGASNLMLVTIIVPVFALVIDAMLLQQFVSYADMAGFGLVAIGLMVMDGRLNRFIPVKLK